MTVNRDPSVFPFPYRPEPCPACKRQALLRVDDTWCEHCGSLIDDTGFVQRPVCGRVAGLREALALLDDVTVQGEKELRRRLLVLIAEG